MGQRPLPPPTWRAVAPSERHVLARQGCGDLYRPCGTRFPRPGRSLPPEPRVHEADSCGYRLVADVVCGDGPTRTGGDLLAGDHSRQHGKQRHPSESAVANHECGRTVGRTRVLARGDGAAGNSVAWVHGEIGVAWDSQSGAGIRVETKAAHQPWQRSTIARGATGGNLRSLDINAAGDLAITWENWKQSRGYSLALALRPAEGKWSAPGLVYTDLGISAIGSVLVQHGASALVAYGDDVRRQAVARRAYLPAGS